METDKDPVILGDDDEFDPRCAVCREYPCICATAVAEPVPPPDGASATRFRIVLIGPDGMEEIDEAVVDEDEFHERCTALEVSGLTGFRWIRLDAGKTPFVIDSRDRLDYVLGRLLIWDVEADTIERNAAEELARLRKRRSDYAARFEGQVKAFVLQEIEKDPRGGKTVRCFHGQVSAKRYAESWKVIDQDAAIAHALVAKVPGVVTTTVIPERIIPAETIHELDAKAYLALIRDAEGVDEATGERITRKEVPPGVEFVPARDVIKIEPGAGDKAPAAAGQGKKGGRS